MDATTRFDTQIIGGLPVITHYFEQLQLGQIVDELVPWEGGVALGTLVEVLVANRLLAPQPMVHIGEWSQGAAVTDYFDLTVAQLNDDGLGRALERLADHGNSVQAALVLRAIEAFDLRVNQIHYDITSLELFGAYEQSTPGDDESNAAEGPSSRIAQPAYGRAKSGRKSVKQLQAGLSISSDGAVPVGHLALDGNAAEAKTHLDNLQQLSQWLPKGEVVYKVNALMQADTVARWHRQRSRKYWTWKSRRRHLGHPRVDRSLRQLIQDMQRANPYWGAPREFTGERINDVHSQMPRSALPGRRLSQC